MDGELERKFSFPNSDRFTKNQQEEELTNELNRPKPVVHITDALNIAKKEDNSDAQTIRTFQNDIADAIKSDNVSMIKVALAEKKRQESRGGFEEVLAEKKSDVMFYIATVVVALVVVVGFIGFVFFSTKPNTSTTNGAGTNATDKNTQIIYTENSTVIDTNNRDANDIGRLVARIKDERFDLGTMKEIVFTAGSGTSTRRITTKEWFTLMRARASDSLVRSLDPSFEMGTYAFSNPYDTFIIFEVNSYDNAFAGMLQWENSMDTDVGDLFILRRLIIPTGTNGTGIGASGSTTTNTTSQNNTGQVQTSQTSTGQNEFGALRRREFIDKVVQNKDTRALVDERGTVLMLYTFIGKDTLVIASGEKSLKEILFRLTTGRIVR